MPVSPIFHETVPKSCQNEGAVAIDTSNPKDMGAVLSDGDTVVLVLAEAQVARRAFLTAQLHAVLAGMLGRKIRLVVLDNYLPNVAHLRKNEVEPPKRSDDRLRQFFWAEDLQSFAEQNGTSVTILRAGPMYGPKNGVLLDGAFWRQVLRGGPVRTPLVADQKQSFVALEDAAHAVYLLAKDDWARAPLGGVEELHLPEADAISIAELVEIGAEAGGTSAFVRPPPYPLLLLLRKWFKRWRDGEDHVPALGHSNDRLADAFSQRIGLALTPHETGVRRTIAAIQKSA